MSRTKKIGNKIALVFITSVGIILIALGVILYTQVEGTVITFAEELGQQSMNARADEIGRYIAGHLEAVRIFSEIEAFRSGDVQRAEAEIFRWQTRVNEGYEVMFFAQLSGDYLSTQGARSNIEDREYFQKILYEGADFAVSNPLVSRTTSNPVFVVAHAVYGSTGQKIGLVAVSVKLQSLSDIASRLSLGNLGYGWIVDGMGTLVAHPNPGLVMKLNLREADEVAGYQGLTRLFTQEMLLKPDGTGRIHDADGNELQVIYAQIPNTPGWRFAISVPVRELYAPAFQVLQTILFLVLSILLIVFF